MFEAVKQVFNRNELNKIIFPTNKCFNWFLASLAIQFLSYNWTAFLAFSNMSYRNS